LKNFLKSIGRSVIRQLLSLIEPVAGFWTDPTGWVPNRIKMLSGNYETFLVRSICEALPENGVFVDVGANVGFISQQIARRFPKARVFAFEPNPRIYPILQKNLKAFPQCESFHFGLGAKAGTLEFFYGEESCVGSFVPEYTRQHPSNQHQGPIAKSQVQVTTGDAALSRVGSIDVMKLDVEGYEPEVLRGMAKLLATGTIKTLFFEFCPIAQKMAHSQPEEILNLLSRSGYAIYELEGENAGAFISAEKIPALVTRLGERGYTTLQANLNSAAQ
jgi:FkbM family methyltransferase